MAAVSSGTPNPDFTCDICCLMMSSAPELAAHKMSHDNSSTTCPICHKVFSSVSNRRYHMATHTNEKAHKCRYCPRKFNWKSQLATHEHIHTGKGLYYCPICGKPCMTKWLLTRHLEVHARAGETTQARKEKSRVKKQNKSPDQSSFSDLDSSTAADDTNTSLGSSLSNSLLDTTSGDDKKSDGSDRDEESKSDEGENVAEDRILACNQCNLTFDTEKSMALHLLTHLVTEKHECKRCNLQFRTLSSLRRHFKQNPGCAEGSEVGNFLKPTQTVPDEVYASLQKRKCIEDSLRHTLAESFSAKSEMAAPVSPQTSAAHPIVVQPRTTANVVTSAQAISMQQHVAMMSSAPVMMGQQRAMTSVHPMMFAPSPFPVMPPGYPLPPNRYVMSPSGRGSIPVVPILKNGCITFEKSPPQQQHRESRPTTRDSSPKARDEGISRPTVQPSEEGALTISPSSDTKQPREENQVSMDKSSQDLSPRYSTRAPSPIRSTDNDEMQESQLVIDLSVCEQEEVFTDDVLDLSTTSRKRKRDSDDHVEKETPPAKMSTPSRGNVVLPSGELDENDNLRPTVSPLEVREGDDKSTPTTHAIARQFQQLVEQVNLHHRNQMEHNTRNMKLLRNEFERVQQEGEAQMQRLNQRMTSLEGLVAQQRDMFQQILRGHSHPNFGAFPMSPSIASSNN